MGLLLLLCGGLLMGRAWLQRQADDARFVVVEVRGDVPRPGYHPVAPPVTVGAAIEAAGGQSAEPTSVPPGSMVRVTDGTATIAPMDQRLVFGLPINLNTASQEALLSVPAIGPARAKAILADREHRGPYISVDDVARVPGIGPATVEQIRPFLAVE